MSTVLAKEDSGKHFAETTITTQKKVVMLSNVLYTVNGEIVSSDAESFLEASDAEEPTGL